MQGRREIVSSLPFSFTKHNCSKLLAGIRIKLMPRHIDYPLLVITLILTAVGLLIISSASVVISQQNFGTPYYYVIHQGIAALVGLAALLVFQRIPYRFWKKIALPLFILSLLLVAAVFIPKIGLRLGGAVRWFRIGPLTFQPSEILKFSLILYLAGWLDARKGKMAGLTSSFIPFLALMGLVGAVLVLQPDIGTLIVIGGSAVILYFIGGGKAMQIGAVLILAAAMLLIVIRVEPYRASRLLVFLDPGRDPRGTGYHINQALIAIGSGGFWGRGFGQSIQKFNYLPEPMGDSVFAVIVEEFGFLGGFLIIALFFGFFLRAVAIARAAHDFFGKLVVTGIASLITFQAFVNIAAISRLLPLTGIPLPFISYAGTSIAITLAMVGVMLNISRHT